MCVFVCAVVALCCCCSFFYFCLYLFGWRDSNIDLIKTKLKKNVFIVVFLSDEGKVNCIEKKQQKNTTTTTTTTKTRLCLLRMRRKSTLFKRNSKKAPFGRIWGSLWRPGGGPKATKKHTKTKAKKRCCLCLSDEGKVKYI